MRTMKVRRRVRSLVVMCAGGVLLRTAFSAEPSEREQHAAMDHSSMPSMTEHAGMEGLYGAYPMSREASGTAWQPDASPMGGLHIMSGEWMLMLHGFAFGIYDDQGGHRGDRRIFSPNMFMGMAEHPLGQGTFSVRT